MSDTPRTDMFCRTVDHTAFVCGKIYQATIETVDASFARQLERELAEAQTEVERLALEIENQRYNVMCASEENQQLKESLADARDEIKRLKKNLRLLLCKKHLDKCENGLFNSRFPDDEPCLMCLEEAAERGGK